MAYSHERPGFIALPIGETCDVDPATLDRALVGMGIDEAVSATARALLAANGSEHINQSCRDALRIALSRLEAAKHLTKE